MNATKTVFTAILAADSIATSFLYTFLYYAFRILWVTTSGVAGFIPIKQVKVTPVKLVVVIRRRLRRVAVLVVGLWRGVASGVCLRFW